MAQINPYLNFKGNCEEAFELYKSVLGGEFPFVGRFKDMPPSEGMPPTPAEFGEKIMHMSLALPNGTTLMGSDACGPMGDQVTVGNNVQLSLNAESEADADRLFNGLSAGGNVIMPMDKTFWGAYFGMFADKFGIYWMVNYDYPRD